MNLANKITMSRIYLAVLMLFVLMGKLILILNI